MDLYLPIVLSWLFIHKAMHTSTWKNGNETLGSYNTMQLSNEAVHVHIKCSCFQLDKTQCTGFDCVIMSKAHKHNLSLLNLINSPERIGHYHGVQFYPYSITTEYIES